MNILDTPLIYFLISALIQVESEGKLDAFNEKENAIGCLQIRPIYIQDLNRFSSNTYTHSDMYDRNNAIDACVTYLRYYGNQIKRIELREPTFEDLARIHNGGELGYCRESTVEYWEKVKKELDIILLENEKVISSF